MGRIVQLSETDALALSLGHLILQGINAASKLDQTDQQITNLEAELKSIKQKLSTQDASN